MAKVNINKLYNRLLAKMGPQGWWPADTKPEIVVGAILVQNTNWKNVEKSLTNLQKATAFDPTAISQLTLTNLEQLIKPSGFFTSKARAIHETCQFFSEFHWDYPLIVKQYGKQLRNRLLDIRGIGPESADVFLVYVFDLPVFIADKYARKLFGFLLGQSYDNYQALKNSVSLPANFSQLEAKELHGLIDEFGKTYLKNKATFQKSFLGCQVTELIEHN